MSTLVFTVAARVSAVVALVCALGSGSARGADDKDAKGKAADADAKAAAKEHFQRGTSYYDLGRYPDAIREFETAYQLKNDPAFLYNLAQSYRQAGDPEQALHFYRTYLRYVPKPPNRAEIDERIAALEKQIADKGAAAVLPPPTGGAAVTPPLAPANGPAPVPPAGPAAAGPGEAPSVAVTATSPSPSYSPPPGVVLTPPSPPPATSSRAHTLQVAGALTAAGGGVLLLVGIVEGVRARSASKEIETEARNSMPFDPEVQKRGQSAEKAEATFITLGILAGAAGAGLWYCGRRLAAAEATTTYRISLAPVVSPTGAGAWLRVRF